MTAVELARPGALPGYEWVVEGVLAAHQRLERLARRTDLEPDEQTNRAFGELVSVCAHRSEPVSAAVLADPRVGAVTARLRQLCADGEFRLERAWARRIAAAGNGVAELRSFPYLDNYDALVALELQTVIALLAAADRPAPARSCILGSGPLPLTALLVARRLGCVVDAVDLDAEATVLARDVLRRLPGGGLVRPRHDDARHFDGIGGADVVLLAALVGLEPAAKRSVASAVADRMRPGALLVVRSAYRLRTLLYPPLTADDLIAAAEGRLRALAEVHPMTDVVNSFVIAERV